MGRGSPTLTLRLLSSAWWRRGSSTPYRRSLPPASRGHNATAPASHRHRATPSRLTLPQSHTIPPHTATEPHHPASHCHRTTAPASHCHRTTAPASHRHRATAPASHHHRATAPASHRHRATPSRLTPPQATEQTRGGAHSSSEFSRSFRDQRTVRQEAKGPGRGGTGGE